MEWIKLKNINGKMLYTILFNNLSQENVLESITKFLEKINKIMSDQYKRKLANDRIYSLKQTIEATWKKKDIINHLFFISDNKIDYFELSNKLKSIANKWNLPNQIIKNGKTFEIDYLVDLFDDIHYYHLYDYNDNQLKYYHFANSKKRLVETIKISSSNTEEEIINNIKITPNSKYKQTILHGLGTILKKIKLTNVVVYNKYIEKDTLLEKFYEMRMLEIHNKFEETLGYINHPENSKLLIFGQNEISQAINDYMIKTLFITPKKSKLLKKNIDNDFLNFEIIELARIKKGDIFDTFVKDYSGILGVLYYSNQ